jgi:hypothetical protein
MEQLAAGGATCLFALVIAVLAMVILGVRDARRNRAYQESRPLEDRIRDFEESAAMWIKNLNRAAASPDVRNADWIPPAIELFRRMEQIAASPSSTPEEARTFAEDALRFDREWRVQGVFIGDSAQRLAGLLERRAQSPNSGV